MEEGMGKFFSVGGYGGPSSMEWMMDDGRNWVKLDLPFYVYGHCISKYNDTHLLLTGGRQGGRQEETASTRWFDMDIMKWSDGPTMEHRRSYHACTTISGNEERTGGVIVVGGDESEDTVEILEFESNR